MATPTAWAIEATSLGGMTVLAVALAVALAVVEAGDELGI